MKFGLLKSLTPRSLIGRTVLILLVPILTIQLVVSYVFIQRLYESVTEQMTRAMLPPMRMIVRTLDENDPEDARKAVERVAGLLQISVRWGAEPFPEDRRVFYDLSGLVVMRTLRAGLPGIGKFDLAEPNNRVQFDLETPQGTARIAFARNRVSASNPHQLLVLMVFVSTVMTIVSFLFLKNQVRPIRRLAEAAMAFGKGRVVPYTPAGATEVRLAGRSFLQMRDRIERHIEQRTLMLSGVSHDLRTPLTRMKLELELIGDREIAHTLGREVDEMQAMLDTFLGFARLDATETPEAVDPAKLAEAVVERHSRSGEDVTCAAARVRRIALRPLAVERALDNLISNGLRHGTRVRVRVDEQDEMVRFRVEDNGPGIPESQRDAAVRPFTRLDSSRNLDHGGSVGLGLSIVRDIARQHGGALVLGESAELGGLSAELILAR